MEGTVFDGFHLKMEIIKTKGLPDKYLWKDQKTKLIDLVPKLKRLPKSGNFKRVFHRTCPNGRRLIPLPERFPSKAFLPKRFIGDILINSKNIVESVLVKFVLRGERAIPVQEWIDEINNILQNAEDYQNDAFVFENEAQENAWIEELKRRMREMKMISTKSPEEE